MESPTFAEFDPSSAGPSDVLRLADEVGAALSRAGPAGVPDVGDALDAFARRPPSDPWAVGAIEALYAAVLGFEGDRREREAQANELVVAAKHLRIISALRDEVRLPTELANELGIPLSTVSTALGELAEAGLVQGWSVPGRRDGRTKARRLTAEGSRALAALTETDTRPAALEPVAPPARPSPPPRRTSRLHGGLQFARGPQRDTNGRPRL